MDIDSELKHEQAQAQELKQRLEESKQESALLRRQREELQASVTSLQEQLEADKARIEFMESTMAAGGDNSKALTQELKRLEAARQEEKDLREACEQELARVRNEAEDLALSKTDLEGSPVSIFEQ